MKNNLMLRGAKIVIHKWLKLKPWQRLLIVTNDTHLEEANLLKSVAIKRRCSVDIMLVEKSGKKVGMYFDEHETAFDNYGAIIGATDYSLVTTKATKRAIERNKKFLSLPLSTNNNQSLLSFDFLTMDTVRSKMMAQLIIGHLENSSVIHVTTELGTDLTFYKRNRTAGFFNGVVRDGNGYSSASIELYIPIEEDQTEGTMVLDGSFGYIGKVDLPVTLTLKEGRIIDIEDNCSGSILKNYIESFQDNRMYVACELGIGLNSNAKCLGNCYIEDESAYGTFHIGFGRNIALGGIHEAAGHFDLVSHSPTIYADNVKIMENGKIVLHTDFTY